MGVKNTAGRKPGSSALPPLLPNPKRVRRRRGAFRLQAGQPILLPADPAPLPRALWLAAERTRDALLEQTGIRLEIERPAGAPAAGAAIRCRIDREAALAPGAATARDSYRLTVREQAIEIAAPSHEGLCFGLQSLTQLAGKSGRIPALDILDQPDFLHRGIMLDVSRGRVPTTDTLEALVDLCARLRLNVLMLYVEHTFAFRRHPEIGAGVSPLDAETLLRLDAFAADRGVELVPCLQSLGHMEHILSLERYAHLAESDRRWSISPSHPESYALLEDLYDEFLPLFRSKRFNANCDEPFDLGRGQSAERFPRRSPGRLFADHVRKLERSSRAHGKQLMIWADFAYQHADEIDRLGRDVVLIDWWYEADFDADRIAALRRQGFEVWTSPGTSAWNCLFPRTENAIANVERWARAGRRHGATGLLNTDWGDFGHYNALGVSLHGYAWGAQQAWSGTLAANAFDRAFGRSVFGEDNARLGRLYRRLGAIHDAGFAVANGSPLQYLYFDGLARSFFLRHAERRALERSARRLAPLLLEIERLGLAEAPDDFTGLARQEIAWAAQATRFAVEKSLAALDYNAWRAAPESLDARGRRGLARRLDALAKTQDEQLASLTRLWLARSAPSEFARTRKRARRSIADLRAGARRLLRNQPPRPPREKSLALLDVFNEMRRQFGQAPRPRT